MEIARAGRDETDRGAPLPARVILIYHDSKVLTFPFLDVLWRLPGALFVFRRV